MRAAWRNPIYVAQVFTGLAAIGAIFADGSVTRLRVYLAALAGLSAVASLLVAARATSDSRRMQEYVETLLRSMELPYFIIENLSAVITRIAGEHNWHFVKQENFQLETVYSFNLAQSSVEGRLLVTEAEFKSIWLLDDKKRIQEIEKRLFGQGNHEVAKEDRFLEAAVREAIFERAAGPLWIGVRHSADGSWVFAARRRENDPEQTAFQITADRLRELRALIPIRRYAVAAQEAQDATRNIFN
jgi:hypothetical protein